MSWLAILVPFLMGLLLLFVPGLLVTTAVRLRGFDAVAIAPPVSVAVLAVSAIIAPMVGVGWSLWVPLVFAVIVAALGFVVTFGLNKLGLLDAPYKRQLGSTIVRTPMTWNIKQQAWLYASVAIGSLLTLRNTARGIGAPDWISQTWDNNFHLNAVRYIVDHNNGSALFVANMTSGGGPATFYPLAWHDFVSLVFMHSDASIPVATNAFAMAVAGVVWPLSVMYMVRSIFRANPVALMLTGIAAASMSSFPFSLIYFGVLYPNLLGYALLPVGIGMMAQLFRVGLVRYLATTQSLFLGLFVALGIALAHPNAVMSMLVLIMPIFIARVVLQIIAAVKKETPWWVVALQTVVIAGIFYLISYLWEIVRPAKEAGEMWHPQSSQGEALGGMLTNEALTSKPLWAVTTLSLIGIFFLIKCRNRLYWVLGMWGVLAYYYVAVRSLAWEDGRYEVVGVWYHDSFRLAALVPIVTLAFVAYGAHQLSTLLADKLVGADLSRFKGRLREHGLVATVLGALAVIILGTVMQTAAPLNNYLHASRALYEPTLESPLLTPDEYNVLEHVDDYVAPDEEILVSPFNGGALAYAFADRKVTAYHTLWSMTEDEGYLYKNLDKAKTDPKVCQILEKDNIDYFLWFGWKEVNNTGDHAMWYPSFDKVVDSDLVEPVYHSGGATLYKITACE